MAQAVTNNRAVRDEIVDGLITICQELQLSGLSVRPMAQPKPGHAPEIGWAPSSSALANSVTSVLNDPVLGDLAVVKHPPQTTINEILMAEGMHHIVPWIAVLNGARFEEIAELSGRLGHYTAMLFRLNEIVGAAATICWTYDDQSKPTRFRHFTSWGIDGEDFLDIPKGEGLVGKTNELETATYDDLRDSRTKVYHQSAVEQYGWTHVMRHPLVTPNGLVGALAMYFRRDGSSQLADHLFQRNATLLAKSTLAAAVEREWYTDRIAVWKRGTIESAKRLGVGTAALGIAHDLARRADQLQIAAQTMAEYIGPLDRGERKQQASLQLSRLGGRSTANIDSVVNTLANLDAEASYLKSVIGQLNVLSRSKLDPVKKRDLDTVVREILPLLDAVATGQLQSHSTRLRAELQRGLSVKTNSTSVARILLNLVTNSVNWNAHEIVVTVKLAIQNRQLSRRTQVGLDGFVALSVQDDGSGMTEGERAHCLDAFVTGRPDGSGLGLFVVDDLVRSFGGRVEVFSEEGVGTTVIALLPIIGDEN